MGSNYSNLSSYEQNFVADYCVATGQNYGELKSHKSEYQIIGKRGGEWIDLGYIDRGLIGKQRE